jgi:hypothetical protein
MVRRMVLVELLTQSSDVVALFVSPPPSVVGGFNTPSHPLLWIENQLKLISNLLLACHEVAIISTPVVVNAIPFAPAQES